VIDDSLMLLSFVKEILAEANYRVVTAATAEEGLVSATRDVPDLVLLDYVLPDMKGDEVSRRLSQNSATAKVRIIYMSGFGADLKPDQVNNANVIGSLNKPFTSDLLLRTVEKYIPKEMSEPESRAVETEQSSPAAEPVSPEPEPYAEPNQGGTAHNLRLALQLPWAFDRRKRRKPGLKPETEQSEAPECRERWRRRCVVERPPATGRA
jgi:DNA-binding response OmpR family regulator